MCGFISAIQCRTVIKKAHITFSSELCPYLLLLVVNKLTTMIYFDLVNSVDL